MGLWEDAQNEYLPEDHIAALARQQQQEIREFVEAMGRLGVAPGEHQLYFNNHQAGSDVAGRDIAIKGAAITGWLLDISVARAFLVVTPEAELCDCRGQRKPKRHFGIREPVIPLVQILPRNDLTQILRETLARQIRATSSSRPATRLAPERIRAKQAEPDLFAKQRADANSLHEQKQAARADAERAWRERQQRKG
ncbi:hypothetical protein [Tsukamurella pseudospumae]|nr:hypothetical protein [Tsukamurella pseudospumae]